MNIGIIGSPKGNKELITQAKKFFSEVVYIPINEIKLEVGSDFTAWFGNRNLSKMDIILPLPTSNFEFFYMTLRILERHTLVTVPSSKFFLWWKKPAFFKLLAENGVGTRKSFMAAYAQTANSIIKRLKLPLIVTLPSRKKVSVTNKNTLSDVLSLFSPGYTFVFKKLVKPDRNIWSLIIGDEIVTSYEKSRENEKRIKINLESELKELVLKVRELLESEICSVNLIQVKSRVFVNDVLLTPEFEIYKEVSGINVYEVLFSYLQKKLKKGMLTNIGKGVISFIRWVENEISNIRSSK